MIFTVRFEEFYMGYATDVTYKYVLSDGIFIVYILTDAEEWEQYSTMNLQMVLDMLTSNDLGILEVKAL